MLQLESKTSIANGNQEQIFDFVSDFRKMKHILPEELMSNVEIHEQNCSFDITGIGRIGLRITEKNPFSQILISGEEDGPADFTLKIVLASLSENQTNVKFSLQARVNMFLEMMAKQPLQQFIDMLADKIEQKDFGSPS